jgi:20S proteasome alpha/beta subunit
MTSLVGIRCTDGIIIGADSSATFGSPQSRTIEQETAKKIAIVGNTQKLVVAGTGAVGHHQRFVEAVRQANAKQEFKNKSEVEVAKHLASLGVNDFASTTLPHHMDRVPYSALVAYSISNKPCLCEIDGASGFQPEIKYPDDLWFASIGSGQPITDPFLALFREVFWKSSPPDLKGGLFTAYWALKHACDINPGGINYPIRIAVLSKNNGGLDAKMLSDDDLAETRDLVEGASSHFASFREILLGQSLTIAPPTA